MSIKAICLFVLLQHVTQINAFSFYVESIGPKQVSVTPGNVITFNAHITISEATPLIFHINLPYFETPIISIEKFEVIGVGSNLQAKNPSFQYDKTHSTNRLSSQLTLNFQTIGIVDYPSTAAFDNEMVLQVQSRVMKHSNVTTNAVFWLYYGVEYINESLWVIGKSVKGDIESGPAQLAAKMSLRDGQIPSTADGVKFLVEIYHLPDSRSNAIDVQLVLSVPSYLSHSSSTSQSDTPKFTVTNSGTTLKLELSEAMEVGVPLKVEVHMAISVADKGKFVHGHIHGDLHYKTNDEDGCMKTIERKQSVQISFKAYAHKDTCDGVLPLTAAAMKASAAYSPSFMPEKALTPPGSTAGWRAWNLHALSTLYLLDNFLQVNFNKTTTITRLEISGTFVDMRFVKSFFVSYSQNSIFWKHVLHLGKPKEFEANTDSVNIVTTLFQPEIEARYLRIHIKKYTANGASMHIKLYGCTDNEDVPSYTAYQRGFLVVANMLILCNVYPDRKKLKTNCYSSPDDGGKWNAIDPRIVNVLGYIPDASKIYGLGVSISDAPVYMELDASLGLRVITEADWTEVKNAGVQSGIVFPTVIPMEPVRGNALFEIPGTNVTVGGDTYVATPEALLKNTIPIASWSEYVKV